MTQCIYSFFIAWALSRITHISTRNIMTVVFFSLGLLLIKQTEKVENKEKRTARGLAIAFSVLYLCGDFEGICYDLSNKLFCAVILIATGLGLYKLFENLLILFFDFGKKKSISFGIDSKINNLSSFIFGLVCFWLAMICWLPYLLKNFPGIMTVDSINQYAQIIGVWKTTNHHPWIHTLVIKLFYNIGLFTVHDSSYAIAFYTIAQMIFMAFCVAYFMVFLKRFELKTIWYVLVMAFYCLIPYQPVYAIAMIKDTPFAGLCLLYTISLFGLLEAKYSRGISLKKDWKNLLLAFVSGVFFCLFRTNGFYAFLVLIPFVVVIFRKEWRLIYLLEILTLAVVLIFKGPVMSSMDIEQPDLVENLSMPGQQISRVIMNERELTTEQAEFLNTIMDTSRMSEGYNPYVSDWFKKLVRDKNQKYLEEHFAEFIKLYIQIGLKYPQDYLVAYRDQTIGYWFPCTDQVEIAANEGIVENEFGLENKALIKGQAVIKINEIAIKLHTIIPGIGIIWSVGAIMWIIVMCLALSCKKGNGKYFILYLPSIAIFLTLLLSTPVAYDFRYAYGYVYVLPMYIFIAATKLFTTDRA